MKNEAHSSKILSSDISSDLWDISNWIIHEPLVFFPGFQWLQVKRIRSWKRKCTVATRRGSKVKKQQQWNGVCQCHETTHETKEQYSKWFGKQKLKKQVKHGLCVSFKPSSLKDVKNARWNQGKQKITHYCHAWKVATVLNFLRLCSEKVYRFGNKSVTMTEP